MVHLPSRAGARSCRLRFAALAMVLLLFPQANRSQQEAGPASAQAAPGTADAAAKAAARRKRFEEEKRRLESGEKNLETGVSVPDQALFVSPAVAGMLVGESQAFSAFDLEGRDLTSTAEWSLSNSYVAVLSFDDGPTITAKDYGTATLRAHVGGQTAEASARVYSGDKLASGTVRWSAPQIPGYRQKEFKIAVPTANGPDLYAIDTNDRGDTLIRALRSDGRQMWMKRLLAQKPEASSPQGPGAPPRLVTKKP